MIDHKIEVTFWTSTGLEPTRVESMSVADLIEESARTEHHIKEKLPLFKLGTFGNKRSEKTGSKRIAENLLSITGIECDYDRGLVPMKEAAAMLEEIGVAFGAYTTFRHTESEQRYRLVLPLSKPIQLSARARLVGWVNGALGGILARESFYPALCYYLGHKAGATDFQVHMSKGQKFIDLCDDLEAGMVGKPGGATMLNKPRAPKAPGAAQVPDTDDDLLAFNPAWLSLLSTEAVIEAIKQSKVYKRNVIYQAAQGAWGRSLDLPGRNPEAEMERVWQAAASVGGEKRHLAFDSFHRGRGKGAERGSELGPLPPLTAEEEEEGLDWRDDLQRGRPSAKGIPGPILSNLKNAALAFRRSEQYRGRLKSNLFSSRSELDGEPIKEAHGISGTVWAQGECLQINVGTALDGMAHVAERRSYHPVRDMLEALIWDGNSRVDTWLMDYAGAEDTPLNRAFCRKFLIALVARVMRPGCKVDTALILEGPQSMKKSTLFRVLCGSPMWFLGALGDVSKVDTWDKLQGVWIVEMSELAQMRKDKVDDMKSFMTLESDVFRHAFGRLPARHLRQFVFVGTVNPGGTGYLKDATGARRFWTVQCGVDKDPLWKIDIEGLTQVRDRLLAEAVVMFKTDEPWWLETRELEAQQTVSADERYEEDPWQEKVAEYLQDRHVVTITEILDNAIKMETGQQRPMHSKSVGAILKRLGWTNILVTIGVKQQARRFVSPEYVSTGGKCNVVTLRSPSLAEIAS